VDVRTDPSCYRHWKLAVDGTRATLELNVDERGGLFPGCDLKLNSYDLSVDIELADAVQRLRFEHPGVRAVLLRSGNPRAFSAGANIRMLAAASHGHKVNFCKFTNETRLAMEEASSESGQRYIAVIAGTAAGGGYELALAADEIILVDDGSATVSLPELPLLAVLPGTGGLTRLLDKRGVRRDLADFFCTTEEGVKGRRAREWKLVDEVVPRSRLDEAVERAVSRAVATGLPAAPASTGATLGPLERDVRPDGVDYRHVSVAIDHGARNATLTVRGPARIPASPDALVQEGCESWALRAARELDDTILHLRFNEPAVGTLVLRTEGDLDTALAHDSFLDEHRGHWFVRELRLLWRRVLKRIDLTSRSLLALVDDGSCFAGTLAELAFAADRTLMRSEGSGCLALSPANFGWYPMSNSLSRLETRFLGSPERLASIADRHGLRFDGESAEAAGLVTFALDSIDWDEEVRLYLESRAAFSPDALTAMEANLRFPGPETMETKIFARLSAWQNWVFQRPNAAGATGALHRYGTGQKPDFDFRRT
jgi:benzoyl-CoA-dihydrodiol lyase